MCCGCGKKVNFSMVEMCHGHVMVKKLVSVCRKQFVVKKFVEACLECVGDPNTFLLRLRVKNSVSAFLESDVVLLYFHLTQNIGRNCLSE
jgi:hypothetical protein